MLAAGICIACSLTCIGTVMKIETDSPVIPSRFATCHQDCFVAVTYHDRQVHHVLLFSLTQTLQCCTSSHQVSKFGDCSVVCPYRCRQSGYRGIAAPLEVAQRHFSHHSGPHCHCMASHLATRQPPSLRLYPKPHPGLHPKPSGFLSPSRHCAGSAWMPGTASCGGDSPRCHPAVHGAQRCVLFHAEASSGTTFVVSSSCSCEPFCGPRSEHCAATYCCCHTSCISLLPRLPACPEFDCPALAPNPHNTQQKMAIASRKVEGSYGVQSVPERVFNSVYGACCCRH